jgi:hypothetical protein
LLQAQAMRITELEKRVKETEQKRTEYEDVTIKLRGLWDQLCEDLALLAQQALSELVWSLLHIVKPCCILGAAAAGNPRPFRLLRCAVDSTPTIQADREALPKPQMQLNGLVCKDPFLAALVAADENIAEERFREEARLEEDYSEVEKQLQERAHQTGVYMQQVLELVRVRFQPLCDHYNPADLSCA